MSPRGEKKSAGTQVSIKTIATMLLWGLLVLGFTALWLLTAVGGLYKWDPAFNADIPRSFQSGEIASQVRLGVALSLVPIVLIGACLTLTLWSVRSRRAVTLGWAALGGTMAALTPVLARVILPWEDPYTGEGSPLASLIGVVFLGALCFCLAAPGGVLALYFRQRVVDQRAIDRSPIGPPRA